MGRFYKKKQSKVTVKTHHKHGQTPKKATIQKLAR